jgi:hypothetical protein
MEIFSTAAGHSLKTIQETPSTMKNGLTQDLRELSKNVSLALGGHRGSLPRVKLVQVSPTLSIKKLRGLQSTRNANLKT